MTAATIAIMQPYFVPYAGYFRLFAASDLFVIYDCVQFPRRGWVHRNRVLDQAGSERWLTLPLAKAPREVLIRDLRFAADAQAGLAERLRPLGMLDGRSSQAGDIIALLRDVRGSPVDYIERLLQAVVMHLGLPWNVLRSSTLALPSALRGQERILEIVRRLGARGYVNAPGGSELYDPAAFAAIGVAFRLLPAYPGSRVSILSRVVREDAADLAQDIIAHGSVVRPS